mgnify:CR=1 FL=1
MYDYVILGGFTGVHQFCRMGESSFSAIAAAVVRDAEWHRAAAQARLLSQATIANMKQNLGFAFIYNALGVPVAAGVLYPFFGILLSPIIAAAAMALSSVSVITNAARLRRVKL